MEKQKNQQAQLPSLTIVILWAIIQSFGWAIIYVLATNMVAGESEVIILGFIGLLGGGVMGALQHTLIDRGIGVSLRHWLALTAIGSAIGWAIIEFLPVWQYPLHIAIMPIFVVPAIIQWISVRRYTQAGILWIAGHIITTLIFVMFYEAMQIQFDFEIIVFVIPAALQGVASGFVMVWLLRKMPKQDLTHEKAKMGYDNKVKVS